MRSGALGASLKVGEFNFLSSNMMIRIEGISRDKRTLNGVFIKSSGNSGPVIANAKHGKFLSTDDPNTLILRLSSGTLIHNVANISVPRILTFSSNDLPIDLPKLNSFRKRGNNSPELTIPELIRNRIVGADNEQTNANLYFRISQITIMFFLPFLGVALGVPPKRSTSGAGAFVAIALVVTFYKVCQYAEDLGGLPHHNPALLMSIPLVVFATFCVWMFYVIAHKVEGRPTRFVDSAFKSIFRFGSLLFKARKLS